MINQNGREFKKGLFNFALDYAKLGKTEGYDSENHLQYECYKFSTSLAIPDEKTLGETVSTIVESLNQKGFKCEDESNAAAVMMVVAYPRQEKFKTAYSHAFQVFLSKFLKSEFGLSRIYQGGREVGRGLIPTCDFTFSKIEKGTQQECEEALEKYHKQIAELDAKVKLDAENTKGKN